jgi:hypothetical protein
MQRAFHSITRTLALTLILGHLLAVAMAGSPWLHQRLHHHAAAPDHTCAVTAVLNGQIDQPDVPELAIAPARFATAGIPFLLVDRPPSETPRNCTRERAPPAA